MVARNYLVRSNNADSVLRKHFSGDMVSAKPRLISDFASGGGGVWGGILRLLHPFSFGEIRGGQKTENTNSILCLFHSTIFRPRSKGDHPRHSPRTFPLVLLAPRCLGLARFLALPPCGAGARAPCCLGEGRNPSPSFGLLLAVVCWSIQCFRLFCGRLEL